VIHLYAVAEGLADLPALAGIDGTTVERHQVDELDVLLSVHELARIEPTEEAVRAHARVVDGLVAVTSALLPARFGHDLADEAALESAVRERLDELRKGLERVRGRVELGLRVMGESPEPASEAASGRAYMEARLEAAARARQAASDLHEPLASLAAASAHSVAAKPRVLLSGAYLVSATDVEAFRSRVAELQAAHPELTFVCTGPWPPYSFAGGDES
jgi:hypothetical protein